MTSIQNAYDEYCSERFPLPTEAQLVSLEQRIGIVFPDEYRAFVLEFNGGVFRRPEITPTSDGCPLETLQSLFGIGATYESAELASPGDMVLFDDNDPPKVVPIGSTGTGGLIILDTAPGEGRGEIYLKQAFGDFYWLTDGIEAFCALLRDPTWE